MILSRKWHGKHCVVTFVLRYKWFRGGGDERAIVGSVRVDILGQERNYFNRPRKKASGNEDRKIDLKLRIV